MLHTQADMTSRVSPVGYRGHLTLVHILLHKRVGVRKLVPLSTLNKTKTFQSLKNKQTRDDWRHNAAERGAGGFTTRKHCWLKLWLMYVASIARFRGELKELPSSCGGSLAVSLTVSKSESYRRDSVQR